LAAKEMVAMYDAFQRQDLGTAQKISAQLSDLVPLMFQQSNPIPVKTALALQGIVKEVFRLPLCPLSSPEKESLKVALKKLPWLIMEMS
jgi:4-hydroxy-tetrahydrodipicolinate synthase